MVLRESGSSPPIIFSQLQTVGTYAPPAGLRDRNDNVRKGWTRPAVTKVPQSQRILRTLATHSKSLSLVTRAAFLVWARAAAKQSA